MTTHVIPRFLTVAGSDSGGGAGLQADLRTASALGCHGASAVTAVTAQNSLGVQGVFPLSPEAVAEQMRSVLSDIGADAAKTGMLFSAPIVKAVVEVFEEYPVGALVVDPVMIAKGGASLLSEDARGVMTGKLFPLALLVTPNIPEAEALGGIKITDRETREEACRRILSFGSTAVLLKGGHGEGEILEDLLMAADGRVHVYKTPRIHTPNTHGTGCTLSAAIAAFLAKGFGLEEAVRRGTSFINGAIRSGYRLGKGHGSTNPTHTATAGGERALLERLFAAWEILEAANPADLIPEVQSNLAEALPDASGFEDVAGFPGRIVKCGNKIRRVEGPRFGATRHMAKILLASARFGSPFRSVMNIRFGSDVIEAVKASGFTIEGFSRADELPEVKAAEGSTLEWGTGSVLERMGYAPDAVFDEGDNGKEPMIRVFGVDAIEVARRVVMIYGKLNLRDTSVKARR